MTEEIIRQNLISKSQEYIGLTICDERHMDILNTYNSNVPLPRGFAVQPNNKWCATFVTAMEIKENMVDLIGGGECGCGELVNIAKEMGIFFRKPFIPKIGDIIMYDFDLDGWSDHTGFVESCDGNLIKTIEGNVQNTVLERVIDYSDKVILGFIAPDYASKEFDDSVYNKIPKGIGTVTDFVWTKSAPSYNSADAWFMLGSNRQNCLGQNNMVDYCDSASDENGKRWCYIAVLGQYVWIPADHLAVRLFEDPISVGDRVRFIGNQLHTSSYMSSKGVAVKSFEGTVERIFEGRTYPFYIRADRNAADGFCKEEDLKKI